MAAAERCILAYPNHVDIDYYTPTLSGGLWSPDAPLTNLQRRYLAFKTRSLDCTLDSTQFVVDLGTPRAIRVIVVPRHNLTQNATVTVQVYTDAALSSLVTEVTQDVFGTVYTWGTLPFEHQSFITGRLTDEEARFFPTPLLVVFDVAVIGQYVRIKISDTDNPAEYVELTRLFISPGYQPTLNFIPGAQIGVVDPTIVTTSLGVADFFDVRTKRRVANIQFDHLPDDEAFQNALDMKMRLGVSGQLYFVYNPTDAANLARTSFLATMRQLDPLVAAAAGVQGTVFQLIEAVA